MTNQPTTPDISDLLTGLEQPLWEGTDEDFATYVCETFGIAHPITNIRISPRGPRGRSAVVAIAGEAGAILFGLTPNALTEKTHIQPMVMGPRLCSTADVVARAHRSDGEDNLQALNGLMLRHLSIEVVLDLLTPPMAH